MNGFNIFEGMKGNFLCERVEIANLSETKRGTKCLKKLPKIGDINSWKMT